jgi:diketogulonate reductase-like aldo/keto reductase
MLSGHSIPILGLGTYNLTGKRGISAIKSALDQGYRLIDSASFYNNEKEVGIAVRETNLDRSETFITTKLWPSDFDNAKKAIRKSLNRLDLEYVDLFLIHWPGNNLKSRLKAWKALEDVQLSGDIRTIGVSNFSIEQIEELIANSNTVPSVNQIHFSPFNYKSRLLQFCKSKGIIVEGYTPIEKGRKGSHQKLKNIATKYQKSPAQILLRWAVQYGVIPIPKSSQPSRIGENISIYDFSLSPVDFEDLNLI